jgi:hypothetical protein
MLKLSGWVRVNAVRRVSTADGFTEIGFVAILRIVGGTMSTPEADVSLKLWSCVGSAGVVNPPDSGKVIFNNSIVLLSPAGRPGGGVIEPEDRLATEARIGVETVTATIRYGVVPVEGLYVTLFVP